MKKGIVAILCFVCLLIADAVYAADLYSPYLNGDRNFILAGGHMGYGVWPITKAMQSKRKQVQY